MIEALLEFFAQVNWADEWLGLLATAITLYSFSIANPLRFRQVNFFAAITWVIYATQLNSLAMLVTNAVIISMHIYYLSRHYKGIKTLELK